MLNRFLHEHLESVFNYAGVPKPEIPDSITQNLNQKFELREYQTEAFSRFIHYFENDLPGKQKPIHLLFNMATGSGKTLIMAGLILYLYEQGYRNFLFFVNADNIIKKTEDNFLNPLSSKYLFNQNIRINGEQVAVTDVANFEGVNEKDINIRFATIQKLHSELNTERENALTFEDFKSQKTVLLSDEAHHLNVSTRQRQQRQLEIDTGKPTWENTVEKIFSANRDNLLLEFTATFESNVPAIAEKYRDKVIYRYDLVKFRNDKYSKDIEIVRTRFSPENRMLQAILLSYYKQSVAAANRIALKPVILFKGKTIGDSEQNQTDFHRMIDRLTGDDIDNIRKSEVPVIQKAFRFFDERGISSESLANNLKSDFAERYCLAVNSKGDREDYQIQVNTLEDKDNPIRAIFAVQMLSEGWDVLNLFDIVRCYDTRTSKNATVAEAQLIGRGARYYPFTTAEHEDRFKRKFDGDMEHDLRVLEELHYHSMDESRYISEIREALIEGGLIDNEVVKRELKLKPTFKDTNFYKHGVIYMNKRIERDYEEDGLSFADLAVKKRSHEHTVREGTGGVTSMVDKGTTSYQTRSQNVQTLRLIDMERNIVQTAIARNPFFTFASLKKYFPQLKSMNEFRTSGNFLGGLAINFKGDAAQLENSPAEKLQACCDLLKKIEDELRKQITQHQGTKRFYKAGISEIFHDKTLKFSRNNPRADIDNEAERLVREADWFAFNGLYGTNEERGLVKFIQTYLNDLGENYKPAYLLRNERHFSIYNFFDGQAFQPDFALFLEKKNGDRLSYQFFIEPKGEHLADFDRWKEDFLQEINTEQRSELIIEDSSYRIIGLPFYHASEENEFSDFLNTVL